MVKRYTKILCVKISPKFMDELNDFVDRVDRSEFVRIAIEEKLTRERRSAAQRMRRENERGEVDNVSEQGIIESETTNGVQESNVQN